jgi:tetratricopeptide (TPR) repeat protein
VFVAAVPLTCGDAVRVDPPVPDAPTFAAHVAPILHTRCAQCHRPDGVAPFPLLTWDDARAHAPLIAAAVRERRMPPWLPEPGDFAFADDRRLSEREIDILTRWAEQGAVAGAASAPAAPPAPGDGWALGAPDLVVEMPEPYAVPHTGADVFRNFVVPVPLERTRYVRAVELQPGDPRVVHHVVIGVDPTSTSRQDDAADPGPGFDGMFSRRAARPPAGFFVGWTPGRVARVNPVGLAWALEPGTDLVVQMHLRPHGRGGTTVQPRIALYFTDSPPARTPVILRLGAQTLDIPPGVPDYSVADSLRIPVDVELLGLYPHAHYLGKVMDVRATLPDGRMLRLLRIEDWDFNWQDAYTFESPVSLPAGTMLRLRYEYDNSAANPRNPSDPPRRVVYGPTSTDEMAELWIQALPRAEAELATLQRELARKSARDHVQGWEHLIALNPQDAVAHASLGAYHQATRDLERAAQHYRRAIEAQPGFAAAHYNLGIVLELRGDTADAIAQYRAALRSRPDHAGTHNNLGNVLLARGRRAEAAVHFRRAIALEPDQAEAHNNLGRLLWDEGRAEQAIAQYRRAIDAQPSAAAARFNLALALAAAGEPAEALEHFRFGVAVQPDALEAYVALAWTLATHPDSAARRPQDATALSARAAQLYGRPHARILDTAAAAEAAAGRFDRAVANAREAMRLATAAGEHQLAARIAGRVELYRLRRPFVEPASPDREGRR